MTSEDADVWTVLVDDEEQYSIWRVGREVPSAWHELGRTVRLLRRSVT
jgi:MbtH protein